MVLDVGSMNCRVIDFCWRLFASRHTFCMILHYTVFKTTIRVGSGNAIVTQSLKLTLYFSGFAKPSYRESPNHPRYDNLPTDEHRKRRNSVNPPHYQNHFFATIYDSDGANGFDPMGSFERQNSNGFDPMGNSFERQHPSGFDPVRSFERRNSNGFDPVRSFERGNSNGFDPLGSFERTAYETHYVQEPDWQQVR